MRELPGRGFAGANVTVPHKGAALALADEASETAREIGAANTLASTASEIEADNTDADGLLAALPDSPRGRQGAGARRRRRGAGGRLGAALGGGRGRGLEPDRRCAPSDSAPSWAARRSTAPDARPPTT